MSELIDRMRCKGIYLEDKVRIVIGRLYGCEGKVTCIIGDGDCYFIKDIILNEENITLKCWVTRNQLERKKNN